MKERESETAKEEDEREKKERRSTEPNDVPDVTHFSVEDKKAKVSEKGTRSNQERGQEGEKKDLLKQICLTAKPTARTKRTAPRAR